MIVFLLGTYSLMNHITTAIGGGLKLVLEGTNKDREVYYNYLNSKTFIWYHYQRWWFKPIN